MTDPHPDELGVATFDALTFDCYGTIVDWESGILAALRPWAAECAGLAPRIDDADLLRAFARAEPAVQADDPDAAYPDVLRRTYEAMATALGLPSDLATAERLAGSVGDWPPFSDSVDALRRLGRHAKLVIVSNVDRASFERTRRLLDGVELAAVVTAEDVGAYKPDPALFEAAFAAIADLGVPADRVRARTVHVAESLFHDITPATQLGLRTVWVDRRGAEAGGGATLRNPDAAVPTRVVRSLGEFADLAGA